MDLKEVKYKTRDGFRMGNFIKLKEGYIPIIFPSNSVLTIEVIEEKDIYFIKGEKKVEWKNIVIDL